MIIVLEFFSPISFYNTSVPGEREDNDNVQELLNKMSSDRRAQFMNDIIETLKNDAVSRSEEERAQSVQLTILFSKSFFCERKR